MIKQFIFVLVLVIGSLALDYHGDDWQRLSAKLKQSALWAELSSNQVPGDWFSDFSLTELFFEPMDTTFDNVGDDMPKQFLNLQVRPKLIHTQGPVALCKFVSNNNHNYTGIFNGFNYGIIRFSLAHQPDASDPRGYIPGIGLKVLRDGMPSVNTVAVFSLEGQLNSWNFFAHDVTNHVPTLDTDTAKTGAVLLLKHFTSVSQWPTMTGTSHFAQYNETGNSDPSGRVVFPYRLIFHPTTKVHTMFMNTDDDHRPLNEKLSILPIGPVYEVYAEEVPYAKPVNIGTIHTTTSTVGSHFSDTGFFLEHKRMDDDFILKPEWVGPATAIVTHEASIPFFTNPDLPWN